MSAIKIVKYKYKVGDLIKFRIHNGNANIREEIVGMVIRREMLSCLWLEEAERKVNQSGKGFLVYEAIHEGTVYSVKENEVLKLISSKPN